MNDVEAVCVIHDKHFWSNYLGESKMVKVVSQQIVKQIAMLRYPTAQRGSTSWLVGTELKYGGNATKLRQTISPLDPFGKDKGRNGGVMEIGGDKMYLHRYARTYSRYLKPYVSKKQCVLAEVGILMGTSLAVWSDLLPESRILGFDIELENFFGNLDNLKELGAFRDGCPELYQLDQFLDNLDYVGDILRGDRLDICIDDGDHSSLAITTTLRSFLPHMADDFLYFVEDNKRIHKQIRELYPNLCISRHGQMTVISRRPTGV